MKKLLALLLVATLTFLSVVLVGCDSKPIDATDADTTAQTTAEETTSSIVKKEFSNDANEIFKILQELVAEDMEYFNMDFEMTGLGHFIYTVAQNGKYLKMNQEGQETEMYMINNVGYIKSPDVDGFIATSDSDMVSGIEDSFEGLEMFKLLCFGEDVESDVIAVSTAVVEDSELGGIKVTFTEKDDPTSIFTVETDSKVYEITEDGAVIGSGITKIKVTVLGTDDGQAMRLDCTYTEINGNIVLLSPI